MELLLIGAGLVFFDLLAVRFGVDSRVLDDARHDWWPAAPDAPSQRAPGDMLDVVHAERLREAAADHLVGQALAGRPPLRVRLAQLMNGLADRLAPPNVARDCPKPAR